MNSPRCRVWTLMLSALLLAALCLPAEAQMGRRGGGDGMMGGGGGGFGGMRGGGMGGPGGPGGMQGGDRGAVETRASVIKPTGLEPAFPAGYACEPISSPFASSTRYDGSQRRGDRNFGLHGGMDLSLDEGTPLLAVASGKVVAKGVGGQLEGKYVWLQHSPQDTGLPFWSYTKYQHFSKLPDLNEGDRVRVGQVVGLSGNTGTMGGHFGTQGYHHLHLSLAAGGTERFMRVGRFNSMVKSPGGRLSDPMILYVKGLGGLEEVESLPSEKKRVAVGVVDMNGAVHPAGSETVWPVRCKAKN